MAPTSKSHGAMRANIVREVTAHPPPGLRRRYRSAAARLAHRTYARNIWKHPRRRTRDHITGAVSQGLRLEHRRQRKRKRGGIRDRISVRMSLRINVIASEAANSIFRLLWAIKQVRRCVRNDRIFEKWRVFRLSIREPEDRSPARPRSPDPYAYRARSPTRADRRSRNSAVNARWPLFVSVRPVSTTIRARRQGSPVR